MYPSKPAHGQFPNPVIEFTAFEFPVRNGQRPVEEPDFWRPHHVFCVEHEFHGAGFKTRPATFGHSQFPATSVVQSVLKLPPERSLIEKALQQTARKNSQRGTVSDTGCQPSRTAWRKKAIQNTLSRCHGKLANTTLLHGTGIYHIELAVCVNSTLFPDREFRGTGKILPFAPVLPVPWWGVKRISPKRAGLATGDD